MPMEPPRLAPTPEAESPALREGATTDGLTAADRVHEVLHGYAQRGIFRGLGNLGVSRAKYAFRMVWHHDRVFDFVFDSRRSALSFPSLLPNVGGKSRLNRNFNHYVKNMSSLDLPEHRRVDPDKSVLVTRRRQGDLGLALIVLDDDLEYGTRKLVNIAHEIYMVFLPDGPYHQYRADNFGVTADLP
jgi:hypothetical protein